MTDETSFARLVSLACHDLRTPLATIHGFAKTIPRLAAQNRPTERYVELIASASLDMVAVVDELSLAAHVEAGRLAVAPSETHTLALARAAAEEVGDAADVVDGEGSTVMADHDRAAHALASLARAVLRHGGIERVSLQAGSGEVRVAPVAGAAVPIAAGEELRDLSAAVALRLVDALGGSTRVEADALVVRFPSGPSAQ